MATFAIGVLTGVAGAAVGTVLNRRRRAAAAAAKENLEERSTTSSAGGGTAAYETRKAVDEYLQFHFGADADILPYANGPKASALLSALASAAQLDALGVAIGAIAWLTA